MSDPWACYTFDPEELDVPDKDKYQNSSDPWKADTDGDSYSDFEEI